MKYYVIDAFAEHLFQGNPAGVCVLDQWLPEALMQNIAMENNLSETAFCVKGGGYYHLRWFTPGGEIDLCGHATLATAFVLANFVEPEAAEFSFETKSGRLTVKRKNHLYEMDFPVFELVPVPVTDEMAAAIGFRPVEAWLGRDLVCVLAHEQQVREADPDDEKLKNLDGLLVHITAKSSDLDAFDCVTRSFAPKLNVSEDPVCGSGHCHVAPLWAKKLGKTQLVARQASRRGGTLYCHIQSERISLSGTAVLYAEGELFIGFDH